MKTASTPFLPVLATMSLFACIAPSALADRAENAFVKVRAVGADVTRVDGRNFSAQGDIEVEIEAQPGWTLLTPSRVRVTKGRSPHYQVRSSGGEQTGGGDIWRTVTERVRVHVQDPALTATLDAGGPYVYAAPANGVWVAVSGSATGTPGLHVWEVRTTVYKNGEVVDTSAEIEPGDPFPLELDRWKWTWSPGAPGETNVQSFVSEPVLLPKGTYTASGTAEAWSSQCPDCHASKPASEPFVVSLLTISCNPWIGQDRTGDPSAPYTSPKVTATAKLEPENPDVKKVTWGGENKCEMSDPKDWTISLWTEDREKASDTYLGETITASACGATATTNFTIVKVDIMLDGLLEDQEESVGCFLPLLYYDLNSPAIVFPDHVKTALAPLSVKCKPISIPAEYPVTLCSSESLVLYSDSTGTGSRFASGTTFSALELATRSFFVSGRLLGSSERSESVSAAHAASHAQDLALGTVYGIHHSARKPARTNPNPYRTKYGVGEEVNLYAAPSSLPVLWATDNGTIASRTSHQTTYTATNRAAADTITASFTSIGKTISLDMQIVEPSGCEVLTAYGERAKAYANSEAGMKISMIMHPTDVSFYRVKFKENDCAATNCTGIFKGAENSPLLYHRANPAWASVFVDNYMGTDTAETGVMTNYFDGAYVWPITASWRVPEMNANTTVPLEWSSQQIQFWATGTAAVEKFERRAIRTTNTWESVVEIVK